MNEMTMNMGSMYEEVSEIQGYADCVQALYHMGLLKENEVLKWAEKVEQK